MRENEQEEVMAAGIMKVYLLEFLAIYINNQMDRWIVSDHLTSPSDR